MEADGAHLDGAGGVSHHLLRLWDGNAAEELVVAENLLMSRDQMSCRGQDKRTSISLVCCRFRPFLLFFFFFTGNVFEFFFRVKITSSVLLFVQKFIDILIILIVQIKIIT